MSSREEDKVDYPLLPPNSNSVQENATQAEDDLESPLVGDGGQKPLRKSYPEVMLVALAAFCAYAAFVVLQKKLSDEFFKDTVLTKEALAVAKREFQHGK